MQYSYSGVHETGNTWVFTSTGEENTIATPGKVFKKQKITCVTFVNKFNSIRKIYKTVVIPILCSGIEIWGISISQSRNRGMFESVHEDYRSASSSAAQIIIGYSSHHLLLEEEYT